MKKLRLLYAVVMFSLILTLFSNCQQQPVTEPPAPKASAEWDKYVSDFIESYFASHPTFAVYQGRHEYDGKLPDWSPAGISKEIERLKSERQRATAFDSATLDERQKFERDYLIATVEGELFWLEAAQWPYRNPTFYSRALDPNVYVTREYAPLADRLKAYTTYAKAIPTAVEQIKSNLRTPLPRSYVDIGKLAFGGLAGYYEKDVPTVFAAVEDSQLQSEFKEANAGAAKAMRDLEAWFNQQQATATDNFSLGPDLYSRMLRETERVEISLDELEKVGRADMDRNIAAMRAACEKYAPGKSIPECVATARAVKAEGGPVEGARNQLVELKKFLQEKNVVSIPGTEEANVAESPPYMRWNFAYIDIPGSYEKGLPSVYYIAPPDPNWTAKEREQYIAGKADLLFTSVHEVWPGHFLHFLHSNRAESKFGKVFVGYAFAEGWAHYTEEMMWEAGLGDGDPETHIGQLLNALMRNGRYLSSIGLHTKGMTLEESERLFREEAFQDPGTAKQQAARGTFDPAYLNYTMGKLMIRRLREDWTASRGGRDGWREFHDKFLSYGGPPIPLVRASMTGATGGPLF